MLSMVVILVVLCLLYKIIDSRRRTPLLAGLSKRVIFITGCDSGFGAALARRLDGLGCYVFAGCLTSAGAEKLRAECSSRLKTVPLDVTDSTSVAEAYNTVCRSLPVGAELWGLVNNAGVSGVGGPLDFLSRKDFLDVFNVNVFGMAEVVRHFLPLLKRSKGRIVNMTSMAGLVGMPSDKPYSASKFAAEGLSDALRREFRRWGVSVSIIEPGFFKTPLTDLDMYLGRMQRQWDALPAEVRQEYGEEYHSDANAEVRHTIASRASLNTDSVVDAYQHALLAVHPRKRYVVGKDAHLYRVMALLPSCVPDFFFAKLISSPVPKVLRT